ncbi:MAG: LytTR family DNA-binding domain-containing protein [Ignavibacteriae bacterium]|nr:LytTR family DNA-binding domain-containing protein [Ignavibacteriota bacterium]
MTILIIEDEKPAAEKLMHGIKQFDASAVLVGPLRSVKESISWFADNPVPDLVFADIQLTDGSSLDVFKKVSVTCPVIFATAYDEYLLEALEHNSIDYLLKPFKQEKLEGALNKYLRLKQHFTANLSRFAVSYNPNSNTVKSRVVVKRGIDFVSVKTDDIAYFYTEHKVVFLVDAAGNRYIVDKPLADLESELDKRSFFRVNRKFLVHINAIQRFKSFEKGKILLELKPPVTEEVTVSQENAGSFREWMGK